jgi:hypothetical protein
VVEKQNLPILKRKLRRILYYHPKSSDSIHTPITAWVSALVDMANSAVASWDMGTTAQEGREMRYWRMARKRVDTMRGLREEGTGEWKKRLGTD